MSTQLSLTEATQLAMTTDPNNRLTDPVDELPTKGMTDAQLRAVIRLLHAEIDRLRLMLAWEMGELSTGQICKRLGPNVGIVEARDYKIRQIEQLRRDMTPAPQREAPQP